MYLKAGIPIFEHFVNVFSSFAKCGMLIFRYILRNGAMLFRVPKEGLRLCEFW